ncbi:hypothetical protein [Streptomyces sp. NPDC001135]
MFARRALAITIATPVLLATIGMTGAAASTPTPPEAPAFAQTADRPEPAHGHKHDEAARRNAEEDEEEGGILGTLTRELAGRM